MNRQLIVLLSGLCLLAVVGGVVYFSTGSAPEPVAEVEPAPAPVAETPAPAPDTPAAEPAPVAPAPRRADRTPAPAPAPEPVEETPVEAAPTVGTLHVTSDVPGAQVFVDRRFVGAAPVTIPDVSPGSHQLNVSATGFESIVQTLDVAPGERTVDVRFREVRLDASVAVVHKHRFGSCEGRLVATPAGLRYETANKDDAFTTTLQALTDFQVDYLEKNLRVRLGNNRQFNFTDPEGNADRLFVFHRDVDRARARLLAGDVPAGN